ncbi:septation ring formation regulator EzrA [Agrilactobacillus yilanensis]|uniref:Septation ring formation regulator EzrA n=1 Tax=Agrilactobacillus yilanensis TaxID=2485997 RepID=A0ABW4J3Z4_9LACO|nr:septation ring formation regulator EzrA [Agrilactobacillus yilanensis]
MLYFLVAVAILALAAYILVIYQIGSNRKKIKILETRQLELANHPQDGKIQKIDALNLSGESLSSYQKWGTTYHTLTTAGFDKINEILTTAQDDNSMVHFPTSKKVIRQAESALGDAEKQMAEVSEAFDKILEKAKQNEQKVAALKARHQDLRKQLLTQSFAFGPALTALENQLTTIENGFDNAEKLNHSSDYLEEQNALNQVDKQIDQLEAHIIAVRPLYAQVVNDFTSQLDEQQQGFDVLRKQQFLFPAVDVPGEIAKLRRFQMTTLQILGQLDIDMVKNRNKQEGEKIDHIYEVMQTEIDSQTFVKAEQDRLNQFFAHAQRQNQNLLNELDHLNQSYIFTNDELTTTQALRQKLHELQSSFDQDIQAVAEKNAIYSVVAADFKKYRETLKETETTQVSIHEKVAALHKGEQLALTSVKDFEATVRNVKRRVSQFNLPGLSKDYLDFYYVVVDEVNQLKHDLNQVKIDLDQITKQLMLTQKDIDLLKQKTEDLIDAAYLGQQMLQYANKYRSENTDVANAVSDATHLFNIEYNYSAALDRVATVIEQLEPGAYKKIEDSYYQSKKNSLV